MALTASVKEELSRLDIKKSSVRKAEVSAMLRFAGGLHIISGRIVIEAEVDLASTARRLRAAIAEVYGHQSEIIVVSGGGPAPRQPLRGAGGPRRRGPGPADRPPGRPRPPGAGPALGRGQRLGRRRRGRVARRLPGARVAHRTGPVVRPWKSPARAPSRRWPSSVPPAVLASRPRPAKSGEWTAW